MIEPNELEMRFPSADRLLTGDTFEGEGERQKSTADNLNTLCVDLSQINTSESENQCNEKQCVLTV